MKTSILYINRSLWIYTNGKLNSLSKNMDGLLFSTK